MTAGQTNVQVCPQCGEALQPVDRPEGVTGFRLLRLEDAPHSVTEAVATEMPTLALHPGRS